MVLRTALLRMARLRKVAPRTVRPRKDMAPHLKGGEALHLIRMADSRVDTVSRKAAMERRRQGTAANRVQATAHLRDRVTARRPAVTVHQEATALRPEGKLRTAHSKEATPREATRSPER
jgi:hypothetical protein